MAKMPMEHVSKNIDGTQETLTADTDKTISKDGYFTIVSSTTVGHNITGRVNGVMLMKLYCSSSGNSERMSIFVRAGDTLKYSEAGSGTGSGYFNTYA